jgi:hypothetical protein
VTPQLPHQRAAATQPHQLPINNQTPNGQNGALAAPVLQTNGFHPPLFHPVIEEAARSHVSQNLAVFLQGVYQKNHRQNGNSHQSHNGWTNRA